MMSSLWTRTCITVTLGTLAVAPAGAQPPRPAVEAPRGASLAVMGAGIGLAAAAATVVFMRWSSPTVPAVVNATQPVPVAAAPVPAVAPVAVTTAPLAAPVVPATALAAPPPAVVQAAPVRRPVARQELRDTEDSPPPAKKPSKAEASEASEKKSVASADALFSGMD